MVPIIDPLIPGIATTVLSVGPAFLGVAIALLAGVAWLASGTAEEMRRTAARDWDAQAVSPTPAKADRLAA